MNNFRLRILKENDQQNRTIRLLQSESFLSHQTGLCVAIMAEKVRSEIRWVTLRSLRPDELAGNLDAKVCLWNPGPEYAHPANWWELDRMDRLRRVVIFNCGWEGEANGRRRNK